METFTVPGAADGVQLSTLVIAPESPKAVLQLVHGMAEHKERYIPFMNYLSEMGYACVICDLRGHGETVTDPKDLGWMGKGGMKALVDDVHCVTDWTKAQYPGLPFFLFGHSMGSMIVRSYLKRYDRDIDAACAILSPAASACSGVPVTARSSSRTCAPATMTRNSRTTVSRTPGCPRTGPMSRTITTIPFADSSSRQTATGTACSA